MYIFEIKPLSVASFAIIFSHSEGCLFTLLIQGIFLTQELNPGLLYCSHSIILSYKFLTFSDSINMSSITLSTYCQSHILGQDMTYKGSLSVA